MSSLRRTIGREAKRNRGLTLGKKKETKLRKRGKLKAKSPKTSDGNPES